MSLCCVSRFIYYYAECNVLFIIMLNDVMLSVVLLNVVILSVVASIITLEAKGNMVNSRSADITFTPFTPRPNVIKLFTSVIYEFSE
jgi:hypothetical protein